MGARRVEGKCRRKERRDRRRDRKGEKSWARDQLVIQGGK